MEFCRLIASNRTEPYANHRRFRSRDGGDRNRMWRSRYATMLDFTPNCKLCTAQPFSPGYGAEDRFMTVTISFRWRRVLLDKRDDCHGEWRDIRCLWLLRAQTTKSQVQANWRTIASRIMTSGWDCSRWQRLAGNTDAFAAGQERRVNA